MMYGVCLAFSMHPEMLAGGFPCIQFISSVTNDFIAIACLLQQKRTIEHCLNEAKMECDSQSLRFFG